MSPSPSSITRSNYSLINLPVQRESALSQGIRPYWRFLITRLSLILSLMTYVLKNLRPEQLGKLLTVIAQKSADLRTIAIYNR